MLFYIISFLEEGFLFMFIQYTAENHNNKPSSNGNPAIMEELGLDNTLLGVDVVKQGEVVASDVTASELITLTQDKPTKVILTVIGGQGHILGRGNQQLSPAFIRQIGKQNMLVVATKQKLQALNGKPLRLDSSDAALDSELAGAFTVITGYKDKVLCQAV